MLLAAAVLLPACSKKSEDTPAPSAPTAPGGGAVTAEVRATVGAVQYLASGSSLVDGTYTTTTAAGEAPARLTIRSCMADGSSLVINLKRFAGAGTYTAWPETANQSNAPRQAKCTYSPPPASSEGFNTFYMPGAAAVGTVTVTAWDKPGKRVQGHLQLQRAHLHQCP